MCRRTDLPRWRTRHPMEATASVPRDRAAGVFVAAQDMTVLHYVEQWLWLSNSFVYQPICASRHPSVVVSTSTPINAAAFPHDRVLHLPGSLRGTRGDLVHEALSPGDARLLRSVRVVHVHHGFAVNRAINLASVLEVPIVASFWGYDVTALARADPRHYERATTQLDCVITPSRYLARIVEALGFSPEVMRVIPGSVDTRFFSPSPIPRRAVVAFVGRFVEKKGVQILLDAWVQVRSRVPHARLVLLGFGDDPPQPDATRGVEVVQADPTRPRQQVRELLASCRVYVSPSRTAANGDSESQHIGNLESMSSNRPVVTTSHAAIPEFVADRENGLVVDEGNADQLAAAIVSLLTDYQLCVALAAEAARHVGRFDTRVVADTLDNLYESLASGK